MEISELTLKLIIILFPGAIATIIIEKLTIHKVWSPFKFIINSIIMGIFSYLGLQLIQFSHVFFYNLIPNCNNLKYINLTIWNSIENSKIIPFDEVLYSSLFGVIVGAIGTKFETSKILNTFGKKLKITNKYGQENLFSYFLNNDETIYIYLRDYKNNRTYFGYIKSFCETENTNEILMGDVTLYTCDTSELMYEIDEVYLSYEKTELFIEKAKVEQQKIEI